MQQSETIQWDIWWPPKGWKRKDEYVVELPIIEKIFTLERIKINKQKG